MEGGIFLLLALLALLIGSRVRNTRSSSLSPKAAKNKLRIKLFLIWVSLLIIFLWVVLFIPAVIEKVKISIDTHFDWDTAISILLLAFGIYTLYVILQRLKLMHKNKLS
jgi:cell division septal protein FtsQ